jgi:aminoglycoside phosphotransferase (APT) family kinase protein
MVAAAAKIMYAAMYQAVDLSDEDRVRLEDYFSRKLRAPRLQITGWELASQGMSDETIFVDLACEGAAAQTLVLRRYRSEGVCRELTDPERHFRVLRAVHGTGVPVPAVLWFEPDSAWLGGPFFAMRRVPGVVPVPWSPEGRKFLKAAGEGPIGDQFVDILARIHSLELRSLDLGSLHTPGSGRDFAREQVAFLAALVRRYRQDPEPIFADALGWLGRNAPEAVATTLVHGDYRTGNLIYHEQRIAAVLDWEFAGIGDPMLDVAWVLARSNRMDSDLACYLLPPQRFLDRYRKLTGWDCDPAALHFWEVFHQVRNAAIWLSAAESCATGRTRDLRLARWALTLPTMRRMVAELLDYP